jgi:hypothetical protein
LREDPSRVDGGVWREVCESPLLRRRVRCPGHYRVLTSQVPLCSESTMRTMQEALEEAEKYASRCEAPAARMEESKGVLEQARAEQAGRARVVAEEAEEAAAEAEAAAAAAAEAAKAEAALERLRMEEKRAELRDRQAALALELQLMDAHLGADAPPAAPAA